MVASHLKLIQSPPDEIIPLFRRTSELSLGMRFIMEEDDEEQYVFWVEKRGRTCFLQATPIDVSKIVADRLFSKLDTVVLTSATLAVSGGFTYLQGRLGLENPRTLVVPGHFDYQKQALLYVPQHLPEPRNPAFATPPRARRPLPQPHLAVGLGSTTGRGRRIRQGPLVVPRPLGRRGPRTSMAASPPSSCSAGASKAAVSWRLKHDGISGQSGHRRPAVANVCGPK